MWWIFFLFVTYLLIFMVYFVNVYYYCWKFIIINFNVVKYIILIVYGFWLFFCPPLRNCFLPLGLKDKIFISFQKFRPLPLCVIHLELIFCVMCEVGIQFHLFHVDTHCSITIYWQAFLSSQMYSFISVLCVHLVQIRFLKYLC